MLRKAILFALIFAPYSFMYGASTARTNAIFTEADEQLEQQQIAKKEEFRLAIKKNLVGKLEELIVKDGINPQGEGQEEPPLFQAITHNAAKVVAYLIKKAAVDPNTVWKKPIYLLDEKNSQKKLTGFSIETALGRACDLGHPAIVKILIDANADFDTPNTTTYNAVKIKGLKKRSASKVGYKLYRPFDLALQGYNNHVQNNTTCIDFSFAEKAKNYFKIMGLLKAAQASIPAGIQLDDDDSKENFPIIKPNETGFRLPKVPYLSLNNMQAAPANNTTLKLPSTCTLPPLLQRKGNQG